MTNKRFIKTVCPIIALFFFFATITPAVVQAQVNEKRGGNINSLSMLKLAMAGKNGQAVLSKEERIAIKEKVLLQLKKSFNKIEKSSLSDETVQKYGYLLPKGFAEKIMQVSDISKSGMTIEEKLQTLTGLFGYSCDDIISAAVIVYVLGYFGVAYFGDLANLLFAAAALCYYGYL